MVTGAPMLLGRGERRDALNSLHTVVAYCLLPRTCEYAKTCALQKIFGGMTTVTSVARTWTTKKDIKYRKT